MKKIHKSLLASAVISGALTAFAQSPPEDPEPAEDIPETYPGAWASARDGRSGDRYGVNATADADTSRNPSARAAAELGWIYERERTLESMRGVQRPKRSFWDRLLGRRRPAEPAEARPD